MGSSNLLTEAKSLELIGQVIVSAVITSDQLILTTQSGATINAGNVRGASAAYPTATQTSFTPTGSVTSTTLQGALAELGADVMALNANKANASDVRLKVKTGTVTQPAGASKDVVGTFSFPAGFFTSTPDVVLTPVVPDFPGTTSPNPSLLVYYSIHHVTTTSFQITSYYNNSTAMKFNYLAVG